MSTSTQTQATENGTCCSAPTETAAPAAAAPIIVTEKAAGEVRRIIAEQQSTGGLPQKIYLRVRVVGGGCSGFTNKLDLDPEIHEGKDEVFDFHGVSVVVDKRSMVYLNNAVVDFHDDLNKRGFSITNPQAKSTCGCGSSYSM